VRDLHAHAVVQISAETDTGVPRRLKADTR
jgi:hypothetical protein